MLTITWGIKIFLPLTESTVNGSVVGTVDTVADLFSSMTLRSRSAMLDWHGSSDGSDTLEKKTPIRKGEKRNSLQNPLHDNIT